MLGVVGQTYPKQWERAARLPDGTPLTIRPVRPEDESLYPAFFARVTAEDLRLRFFAPIKELGHSFIERLTHLDYERAMAFVAIHQNSGELLGVARLHRLTAPANNEAEYAILIRSDLKGHGLGWMLMQTLIEYAKAAGITEIAGEILPENATMLKMCEELGFHIAVSPHDPYVRVVRLPISTAHG